MNNCKLTDFEYKIARALAEGMDCRQILEWFGISYKDYVNCKRRIFRKLNVKRSAELFLALFPEFSGNIINF